MLDKLSIIDNIRALAKYKKINLSDLEKESGVSVGYFARLYLDIDTARKSEFTEEKKERPLPSVEVMYKVSKLLGISLDKLMDTDFINLGDPELSIIFFLDSLTTLTNKNKFIWKKEAKSKVLSGEKYDNLDYHPLVTCETKETYDVYEGKQLIDEFSYYSLFNEDTAELLNDVFRLDYNKNVFFLSKIRDWVGDDYTDYYELYGLKNDKLVKIAHAKITRSNSNSPFLGVFDSLFKAASKCADINPTGNDVVDLINEYIRSLGLESNKK